VHSYLCELLIIVARHQGLVKKNRLVMINPWCVVLIISVRVPIDGYPLLLLLGHIFLAVQKQGFFVKIHLLLRVNAMLYLFLTHF